MHWLVYIGLIWGAIYVTSIVIALLVNLVLPIPPQFAALAGLVGAMVGVFYYLIKYAGHPVRDAIGGIDRPTRPTASIGDVVGEEDFGGIIEELRGEDSTTEDAEDPSAAITEGE